MCRKDNSDEAALICAGRLFHARAAATGKARSPRVTRRAFDMSNKYYLLNYLLTYDTMRHWVRFTRRLFNSNNLFGDQRPIGGGCALLNVVLT